MISQKVRAKFLREFYRRSVYHRANELSRTQWLTPGELQQRQRAKLAEVLAHAAETPYYRGHLAGMESTSDPFGALKALPALEKSTVAEKGKLLLHPRERVNGQGSTSGSTGISLSFYYDRFMVRDSDAYARFSWSWFGVEPGDRYVLLWGRPLRGWRNRIHLRASGWLRGALVIEPWELSEDRLLEKWRRIKRFRPVWIRGYAQSLAALARAAFRGGEARELGVKFISSTAETLYPSEKKYIADVFGCPVAEEYGAAEVSIMASECPSGNLHIATERVFIEFVDEEGRDVEHGQPGQILVTSFANRAQPLLRYRIGDVGVPLADICSCGRGMPLMKLSGAKIIEMVHTPNGKVFSAEIFDYINLALMRDPAIGIRQFRVTQKDVHTFVIEIVPGPQFGEHSQQAFARLLKQRLDQDNLRLSFILRSELKALSGGKLLYFQSEVSR